ncbi:MAG: protein TolR [bacterium]
MALPGGNNNLPMSEINVTPLVDVMLVLLIIFMVAAPYLEQGVKVELPHAQVEAMPAETEEVVISVTRDRKIFLDADPDKPVALSALGANLKRAVSSRKTDEVYLRADKDVDYGFVVQVMAEVQNTGIKGMGMVTKPEDIKAP